MEAVVDVEEEGLWRRIRKSFGAVEAFKTTTAVGRAVIRQLFGTKDSTGIYPESCGTDGFRLCFAQPPFGKKLLPLSLTGSKKCLEAVCWDADSSVVSAPKRKRDDGDDPTIRFDDGRTYYGRSGGKERGIQVHEEVEHFILWSPKRFKHAHPGVDPMTKAVLCRLGAMELVGIDSERIVYRRDIRAGTGVDFLCLNKHGQLVTGELKTGSDDCFDLPSRSHPFMFEPFDHLPNSPLNRARMQLLFGNMLLEHSHGVVVAESFVVHAPASAKCAVAFDLGPVADCKDALLKALIEWREQSIPPAPTASTEYIVNKSDNTKRYLPRAPWTPTTTLVKKKPPQQQWPRSDGWSDFNHPSFGSFKHVAIESIEPIYHVSW